MKTQKIICNITGKILFATSDYYEKKVSKAGSEDALRRSYVCKDALDLLKKGHTVEDIHHQLQIENFTPTLTADEIAALAMDKGSLRLNNLSLNKVDIIKTDEDVKNFIKNILQDE